MITHVVKLHTVDPGRSAPLEVGQIFHTTNSYTNPFGIVDFGNRFTWNRDNVWKFVETLQDGEIIVEHICMLQDGLVIPYISKYFVNSSVNAFTQIYVRGLQDGVCSIDMSNQILNDRTISAAIFPALIHTTGKLYPTLADYLQHWQKYNLDMYQISPTSTYLGSPNSEISIMDYYLPLCKPDVPDTGLTDEIRWFNHGVIKDGSDLDIIATELSDTIGNAYQDVRKGREPEELLTDILIDTFAPWKRFTYRDGHTPTPHLGSKRDFIDGKMTISHIQRYMDPHATDCMYQSSVPDALHTPLVGQVATTQYFNIPEYTKEYVAIVEFIQTINLTEFCFKFSFDALAVQIYNPEVIYGINRYYPNKKLARFTVLEHSTMTKEGYYEHTFADFLNTLGKHILDWLVTCEPVYMKHYSSLCLIKNYNEELFFYFSNGDEHADVEVFYCDLIADTLSGRNMCNAHYNASH